MVFAALPLCLLCSNAYSGSYTRNNPTPVISDMGTVHASVTWATSVTNFGVPRLDAETQYIWQWAPTGGDWTADPAPGRNVKHSYVLGGGPIEAAYDPQGIGYAEVTFTTKTNFQELGGWWEAVECSVIGGNGPKQTADFPVAVQDNQTTAAISPDAFGRITAVVAVNVNGWASASGFVTPCAVSGTAKGTILTTDATLVP